MRKAQLFFPTNWSACVSAPHLGLPLLEGVLRDEAWDAQIYDLSNEFYTAYGAAPPRHALIEAAERNDCSELDALYFAWEDQFRMLPEAMKFGREFGLLSGFSFQHLRDLSFEEANEALATGTVYTAFIRNRLVALAAERPDMVAVTIASEEQLLPAVELLRMLRELMPDAYCIVGGNIITRLRDTSVVATLRRYADRIVFYQGEAVVRETARAIDSLGVRGARESLAPIVDGSQRATEWPLPAFRGIDFDRIVGVPALSYVSTRGCYFGKCSFCAIPAGWAPNGYAGTRDGRSVGDDLVRLVEETGVKRVKFVDEAFPPAKIPAVEARLAGADVEWEVYARLEATWGNPATIELAYRAGLRKIYFGLEQAPTASRAIFGKNDHGDPGTIVRRCADAGIAVHLFCMVGHPRTSVEDAWATIDFLFENLQWINTADLVGFRLDWGTTVAGVRPRTTASDWHMALPYDPMDSRTLSQEAVAELEAQCQEAVWQHAPRLLHPLYRLVPVGTSAREVPQLDAPYDCSQSAATDGFPEVTCR